MRRVRRRRGQRRPEWPRSVVLPHLVLDHDARQVGVAREAVAPRAIRRRCQVRRLDTTRIAICVRPAIPLPQKVVGASTDFGLDAGNHAMRGVAHTDVVAQPFVGRGRRRRRRWKRRRQGRRCWVQIPHGNPVTLRKSNGCPVCFHCNGLIPPLTHFYKSVLAVVNFASHISTMVCFEVIRAWTSLGVSLPRAAFPVVEVNCAPLLSA